MRNKCRGEGASLRTTQAGSLGKIRLGEVREIPFEFLGGGIRDNKLEGVGRWVVLGVYDGFERKQKLGSLTGRSKFDLNLSVSTPLTFKNSASNDSGFYRFSSGS